MIVRIAHIIGLTNLSDKQINRYYRARASQETNFKVSLAVSIPIAISAIFFLTLIDTLYFKNNNRVLKNRIIAKESVLAALKDEHHRLVYAQSKLVANLKKSQMSTTMLNNELDSLIQQNLSIIRLENKQREDLHDNELDSLIQQNKSTKHLKMKQREDLHGTEKEIMFLLTMKKTLSLLDKQKIPEADKEKQIKALQDEIRAYLLLGLKSKSGKS